MIPAQTLTSFNLNKHRTPTQSPLNHLAYVSASQADWKELQCLQCHANLSVFQVLICLKSKKEKSGTLVLSLVLDIPIRHLCLAIHLDRPVTPVSRLSETRMFTLQSLKFKEVINKERMNSTELLLYLWLFCHYIVPAVYA